MWRFNPIQAVVAVVAVVALTSVLLLSDVALLPRLSIRRSVAVYLSWLTAPSAAASTTSINATITISTHAQVDAANKARSRPRDLPGWCPQLGADFLAYQRRQAEAVRWLRVHAGVHQPTVLLPRLEELPFRVLYVVPDEGGLGNRLQCILSGYVVALLTDRVLLVDWPDITDYLTPRGGVDWRTDYLHPQLVASLRTQRARSRIHVEYAWWHAPEHSNRQTALLSVLVAQLQASKCPVEHLHTIYAWGASVLFEPDLLSASQTLSAARFPATSVEWTRSTNTTVIGCLLEHLVAPVARLQALLHLASDASQWKKWEEGGSGGGGKASSKGSPTSTKVGVSKRASPRGGNKRGLIGMHIRNGDNPLSPRMPHAAETFASCAHQLEMARVAYIGQREPGHTINTGSAGKNSSSAADRQANGQMEGQVDESLREQVVWYIATDNEAVGNTIRNRETNQIPPHHILRRWVVVGDHGGLAIDKGLHIGVNPNPRAMFLTMRDFWRLTTADELILSPDSSFSSLVRHLALNHQPHIIAYNGHTCTRLPLW
jgi:Xyloglucan fucosyltransferase